jgi:hypothetical protein
MPDSGELRRSVSTSAPTLPGIDAMHRSSKTTTTASGPFKPIENQLPVRLSSKELRASPRAGAVVGVRSVSKEGLRRGSNSKELGPNVSGSPTVRTVDIQHHFLGADGEEVDAGKAFSTIRSVVKAISVSVSTFKEGLQGDLQNHNLQLSNVARLSFADPPEYPIHLRPFKGLEKILTKEREEGKHGKDVFILEWKKPAEIPAEFLLKCTVDFGDAQLEVQPLSLRVGAQSKASSKGACAVQ